MGVTDNTVAYLDHKSPARTEEARWQEPGEVIKRVTSSSNTTPIHYTYWEYALQMTDDDVQPPRVRIAATRREGRSGKPECFSVEYTDEGYLISAPELVARMGCKEDVLLLARIAKESVQHGANAAPEKVCGHHTSQLIERKGQAAASENYIG